tara:strand:+ start:390 stop:1160 length:771 start_codon:yes stop_codon:yes gene_type:complete
MKNMKNTILSIMFLCTIGNITAQRSGFGIHAGVNATGAFDLENGYYDALDPLNGFQLGIRYNLKFGPIGICPELNFLNVKYNYPAQLVYAWDSFYDALLPVPSGETSLNYISVPIILKFYIGGINLQIGTQTSYLIGGKNNIDGVIQTTESEDITSDSYYISDISGNGNKIWTYNDVDIAAVFGLGLDTKSGLYLSWRNIISITPIDNLEANQFEGFLFDTNGDGTLDLGIANPYYNNNDFLSRLVSSQISIGYKF